MSNGITLARGVGVSTVVLDAIAPPPTDAPDAAAACLYDRWHARFAEPAAQALGTLLGPQCAAGTRLLDVCCGTGHASVFFGQRGCTVTGVDGSRQLLEYASARLAGGSWFVSDVARWLPPGPYDAAIFAFDSVNHIVESARLRQVFDRVRNVLVPGGCLVFDFTIEEEGEREPRSAHLIDAEHAMIVEDRWDHDTRIGHTSITAFVYDTAWRRVEAQFAHRCYHAREIWTLLVETGFRHVSFWPAHTLGMPGDIGRGRWFARAS
jgi:SAM-dependent methyltransferase